MEAIVTQGTSLLFDQGAIGIFVVAALVWGWLERQDRKAAEKTLLAFQKESEAVVFGLQKEAEAKIADLQEKRNAELRLALEATRKGDSLMEGMKLSIDNLAAAYRGKLG